MTSQLASALDRSAILSRLPSTVDGVSDWGGDQADDYVTVKTDIPCRTEINDIDTWTIWITDESIEPLFGDRLAISPIGVNLDVRRVQPWTALDGTFSHYEIMGSEITVERKFTDSG